MHHNPGMLSEKSDQLLQRPFRITSAPICRYVECQRKLENLEETFADIGRT